MKIIEDSPQVMVVKDQNLGSALIGFVFVGIGVVIFVNPSFFVERVPNWVGAIFFVFGLFPIIGARLLTVRIDKGAKRIVARWRGLVRRKEEIYSLDDIKEVQLEQVLSVSTHKYRAVRHEQIRPAYHLLLVFRDGGTLGLGGGGRRSGLLIWGKSVTHERVVGQKVATFLGVPFKEAM